MGGIPKENSTRGEGEDDDDPNGDDGFDDPFFNDESSKPKPKKERKKTKSTLLKDTSENHDDQAQRSKAELELIMQPEILSNANTTTTGKPFDMRAIVKAEKEERKKKKKRMDKNKDKPNGDAEGGPESAVNHQDPRFASLYTDPEFAIDPTSHKFRDTKG